MPNRIDLPTEIDQANKTPRSAFGIDYTSGVKTIPPNAPKLLLVAQKLAAGSQPVATPVAILRETAGEPLFGKGSILDRMIKAAFKANPNVDLTAVCLAEGGGDAAATATDTITGTATSDGTHQRWINGELVESPIVSGDTPTVQATALVTAINAKDGLPVTAANVAGVITYTARTKGVSGNEIQLRAKVLLGSSVSVALSASKLSGGTGTPSIAAALAATAAVRYHKIAAAVNDSTQVAVLRDFCADQDKAEVGKGQVGVVAVNAGASTATTLGGAINGKNVAILAINGTERWFPEIAAATAAVLCKQTRATKPFNGMVVAGIDAPAAEARWTKTEKKNLYNNGCSPLVVNASEQVCVERVITSRFKNDQGNPDYTLLDLPILQGLHRTREVVAAYWDSLSDPENGGVNWAADPEEDDDYPADVLYPSKASEQIFDLLLQLQAEGTLQNVRKLRSQLLVEKDGSKSITSVPADVVDGLHEKYGKIVLIRDVG